MISRAKWSSPTHVGNFIALEGGADRPGWSDYESILARATPVFARPDISESDLLTINYTSGTTAKPKGVMITHRNAYLNSVGTLVHVHMTCADRYAWTLPMFHANGWTFVWTVTAVGGVASFTGCAITRAGTGYTLTGKTARSLCRQTRRKGLKRK